MISFRPSVTPEVERLLLPTNLLVLKHICCAFATRLSGPDLITRITEERQKGEDDLAPKCPVGVKEEWGILGWLKLIKASVCWIFEFVGGVACCSFTIKTFFRFWFCVASWRLLPGWNSRLYSLEVVGYCQSSTPQPKFGLVWCIEGSKNVWFNYAKVKHTAFLKNALLIFWWKRLLSSDVRRWDSMKKWISLVFKGSVVGRYIGCCLITLSFFVWLTETHGWITLASRKPGCW